MCSNCNAWKPVIEMQKEPEDNHLFVVISQGRMSIIDRRNRNMIDQAGLYYPIPDPPKLTKLYVEPDHIDDSWISSKKNDNETDKGE